MDLALVIVRFIHYAALMLVFGGLVYVRILSRADLGQRIYRQLGSIWRISVLIVVLSGIPWLMLATASMGDGIADALSLNMLATVAFDTAFGRILSGHLVISGVLFLWLAVDQRRGASLPSWWAVVAAFASLVSLAPTGHAMMPEGTEQLASIASQALHLGSGGYWIGCLAPVVITLRMMDRDAMHEAVAALTRFSRLGHGAVALVTMSGLANLWFASDHRPMVLIEPYAALFLAKVIVVAGMVVLAIYNRYWLVPRIRRDPTALPRMQRLTIGIFALGLAAIGLVSIFGMVSPT